MARPPMPAPAPALPPAGVGGAVSGGAPGGADPNADPNGGASQDSGPTVVCTITKGDDGSYTVYAGDEPDNDDMSGDDAAALGGAGGASDTQGMPADSIGAALKAALDILNADKSSDGAPGNADDQFQAGFSGSTSPTPALGGGAGKQKY